MRPDGYHELRTVFQAETLHDTLECIQRDGPFAIECDTLWKGGLTFVMSVVLFIGIFVFMMLLVSGLDLVFGSFVGWMFGDLPLFGLV